MLIAIVGDEPKFCAQLQALLISQQYEVMLIPASAPLPEILRAGNPQLLVFAPDNANGKELAVLSSMRPDKELRGLPFLVVNPQATNRDVVLWLDAGADDFINRPFAPPIFLARVRTLLRRRVWSGNLAENAPASLSRGPFSLKLISREALVSGKPIFLTRLEFDLFAHLMKTPSSQPISRQDLLAAVWKYPEDVETRTLDKHIETLRRKLSPHGALIETVRGVGYRLSEPPLARSTGR